MAKKAPGQKKKGGAWKWILGFLVFCVIFAKVDELNAQTGGVAVPLILIVAIVIIVWASINSYKANSYLKKNIDRAVFLSEMIDKSPTLEDYFEMRDELLLYLQTMAKQEPWISRKYLKSNKPSDLLKEFERTEPESVHAAIFRASAFYKKLIKDNGPGFSRMFAEHLEKYSSQLSQENLNDAQICLRILQDYEIVAGKIEETDHMEGHQFEYWCADLLRKNGFSDIEVTQGSGDQGVDIIATKDGIRYAVQCKCYSSDLGNTPVQEVHTGKSIYHCQVGAVMTNRYFTAGAKQAADATGTLLWDRDKLVEMLERIVSER